MTPAPWLELPDVLGAVALRRADVSLDGLVDLPDTARLAIAEIDPSTGDLWAADWRATGDRGFYPASTIKWITAALTLALLDERGLSVDHILELQGERPATFRELLAAMLVTSDNDAFNVLQEAVGFAETHGWLRAIGCRKLLVRRHFTRPHWNHSRAARVWDGRGRRVAELPARPAVDLPLNDDDRDPPRGSREQNWATPNDLLRIAAATLMGPVRRLGGFELLTAGLSRTDRCGARAGIARHVTAALPHRPGFVVLGKPGWWPADGDHAEFGYVHDPARGSHHLFAIYVQGEPEEAPRRMGETLGRLVRHLHEGGLRLAPERIPSPAEG